MSKKESIFEQHIEDAIATIVFALLLLYFFTINKDKIIAKDFTALLEMIIYPLVISLVVWAIGYIIRKAIEKS